MVAQRADLGIASAQGAPSGLDELEDTERWPEPAWFRVTGRWARSDGYDALFRNRLRSRYMELEGRFRGIVAVHRTTPDFDEATATQICGHLRRARELLERRRPDTHTVCDTLDLAERYMIWVTPEDGHAARLVTLETLVDGLPEPDRSRYKDELRRVPEGAGTWEGYRSFLNEVVRAHQKHEAAEAINRGLQVRRLRALRNCGVMVLAVFLLVIPLAAARTDVTRVPGLSSVVLGVWLTGLAVALVSGAAGYLSGLLQVRETRVDLVQYQTSVLKLQLRPIVGGIVSLALFVLLSWNIVPGVRIENRGSLFLVAFLAGFSERYFLRLLELRVEDETEPQVTAR